MLAFKRIVAADPALQDQLGQAESEDDFHQKVAALGADKGFSFTPSDSKAFVAHTFRLRSMVTEEGGPDPPPPPSGTGYTCDSADACTWNPYKC
jgi:hypothetical protein